MKNFIKLALIGSGLVFSVSSFAGTAEYKNKKTSCYIFKSNKLVKQGNCTYQGMSGGNGHGSFQKVTFNLIGFGKISFEDSVYSEEGFSSDGSGELPNAKYTTTLNGMKAVGQFRNPNSFQLFSKHEADSIQQAWYAKGNAQHWKNMGKPPYLKCYKQKSSGLELCYFDNIPS